MISCSSQIFSQASGLASRSISLVQADILLCITMNLWKDLNGSLRMNPTDFGDPPTFPSGPPLGWNLTWFLAKCQEQLLDKFLCDSVQISIFTQRMKLKDFGDRVIFHLEPTQFSLIQ